MSKVYPTTGYFARKSNQQSWACEAYQHLHNPVPWLEWLFERTFDEFQTERVHFNWVYKYFNDTSGRSTGKTDNNVVCELGKNILISRRRSIMLALNEDTEEEIFLKHVDAHIDEQLLRDSGRAGNFRQFVTGRRQKGQKKATHSSGRHEVYLINGSSFYSIAPNINKDSRNTQTHRTNGLMFNEWTTWPDPSIFDTVIKPINSFEAPMYVRTRRFRETMERYMGEPLGVLSDDQIQEFIYEWRKQRIQARAYLEEVQPLSEKEIKEKFLINFHSMFEFPYEEGIKYGFLQPIRTLDDIREFFSSYILGDPVYDNSVIYDGSAKYQDSPHYDLVKRFQQWEERHNPLYKWVSYSIDEVSPEFEGIIYDPVEVSDAHRNMSEAEFDRVYRGIWQETPGDRVYAPKLIKTAQGLVSNANLRLIDQLFDFVEFEGDPNAVYIGGVDPAKGTEGMASGKSHTGDEAGTSLIKMGDMPPYRWVYCLQQDDIRAENHAMTIHRLNERFPVVWWMLDPGGGGSQLAEALGKEEILYRGERIAKMPIVPYDYEGEVEEFEDKLMYVSRSNDIIKTIFIKAGSEKSTFNRDDMLVNKIHDITKMFLERKYIAFPPKVELHVLETLHYNGEIDDREYQVFRSLQRGMRQLGNIKLEKTKDGIIKRTKNGMFMFTSSGLKDLAYTAIYALFGTHIWQEYRRLSGADEEEQEEFFMVTG